MRNKARTILLGSLAVVAALCALAERSARRLPMDALVYQDSADPHLRFELRPGSSGLKDGARVEINSVGQRGPEPAPKAPGAARVAFIGGHETFGLGVELADLYVGVAAAGAAKDIKGPVETVNLSMYSYTLGQKVRLACARLSGLQADAAVLQLSDDDFRELPPPGVNAPALKNMLRGNSAAFRAVAERRYWRRAAAAREAAENPRPAPAAAPSPAPDVPVGQAQARLVEEQLAAFKRCLDEAGARGGIVLVPNLSLPVAKQTPETAAFRAALRERSRALGLEFEDAGPALRRLPPADALKRPKEPVLAPAGHRALGESVRALLKRLKLRAQPPLRPSA